MRLFSKLTKFKQKKEQASKILYQREMQIQKEKLSIVVPEYQKQKQITYQDQNKNLGIFGQSSDQQPTSFFLQDLGKVQYSYIPKSPVQFTNRQTLIFKSNDWKFRYGKRIIFPVLATLGISLQPYVYGIGTISACWLACWIAYSRCKLVKALTVNQQGTQLKVSHGFRTTKLKIKDLTPPSGNSFLLWKAYQMPDDLMTYVQNQKLNRVAFIKKVGYKLFLFPKQPAFVNKELLINSLNGIYIDFDTKIDSENINDRYLTVNKQY